ncbi:MBL fold metallo-hydrolase [candidate division WOR-3 bacterium]|nr:MBL fold metallo-hydrolase [candidate division WOR-3 bacterium]
MDKKEAATPIIEQLVVGPLETNCYILKSGEEMLIVDPGGDGKVILNKVAELGGTVKLIVNTHGHIDHIAANKEVQEATGAQLLIHQLDEAMLTEPNENLSVLMGMMTKSPRADQLLSEGDEIVVGKEHLQVVHTPGHTPGSICLLGKDFAFTGDTLFVDSIGRCDLPGGSERQMQRSLSRLQSLLKRETMLYPGHGPSGTFGRALLVNPFLGSVWPA